MRILLIAEVCSMGLLVSPLAATAAWSEVTNGMSFVRNSAFDQCPLVYSASRNLML